MSDQPDRIRVWNEETREMMEPITIQEMLCMERNVRITEGWSNTSEDPLDPDLLYGQLVFMRNTGICDHPSTILRRKVEIFAEDLITHSNEPWLYRVTQKHGCWWAMSLRPDIVMSRPLNKIFHPTIVGNVFENRELVLKGEVIDDRET